MSPEDGWKDEDIGVALLRRRRTTPVLKGSGLIMIVTGQRIRKHCYIIAQYPI